MTSITTPTLAEGGPFADVFFRDSGGVPGVAELDTLFMFIFWVSMFFFVLLMGLMLWWGIKYRRRPGVPAAHTATHNTPLELAWSIGPLLILVVMFFWGFDAYLRGVVAPGESVTMTLQAQKWNWSIEYPRGVTSKEVAPIGNVQQIDSSGNPRSSLEDDGTQKVPVFAMPAGVPVNLRMISSDVIHSFWVPSFRRKFDVFPNRYTNFWFETPEIAGDEPMLRETELKISQDETITIKYIDHWIFCAEYCGDQHSEMAGILRVMAPADFEKWLSIQEFDPNAAPWERGQKLYMSKGCATCHSVTGQENTGPPWNDVWGSTRNFTDGSSAVADENYIRESILVPTTKIVQGYTDGMTPYQGRISEQEISDIIAFMRYLKEGPPEDGTETDDAEPNGSAGDSGDTPEGE